MKLIDAEELMKALGITSMDCEKCAWFSKKHGGHCKRGPDFEDVCFAIENASEAIVRCIDCKYANHTVVYGRFMCNRHDFPVKLDSGMFCADGKREG